MKKNTFVKAEKLCSNKLIEHLFKKGDGFNEGVIRVVHCPLLMEDIDNHQVLISVSKKKINKASKRNPIKRKIREAYRLNKHFLISSLEPNNIQICFALIYRASDQKEYKEIEDKIILSLQRLAKIYGKDFKNATSVID